MTASRSPAEHPAIRTPALRLAALIVAGFVAWGMVSEWGVPALIAATHGANAGPDWLFAGGYPLEEYLARWSRIASWLTVGAAAAALLLPLRARIGRALRREPALRAPVLLLLALACGLAGGLAEAALPVLRGGVSSADAFAMGMLWMMPVSAALGFAFLGFALIALLRAWRRPVAIRVAVALLATPALFGILVASGLRLYAAAALLLAAGAAVQLGRLSARAPDRFRRILGLTTGGSALIVGALATGWVVRTPLAEGRALAVLPDPVRGAANVLLIILDTVRAESTSLHGYARATTPALERVAAEGITFERAITPAPWTLPAHASFFTGVHPAELSADYFVPLDDQHRTLAEALAERGYATGAFVANLWFATRATGLDRGFHRYEDYRPTAGTLTAMHWLPRRIAFAARSLFANYDQIGRVHADDVNHRFLRWLDGRGAERPFFAFLNYFDAHHPYETRAPFSTRFTERAPRHWLYQGGGMEYDAAELSEIRDAYDAALAYTDDRLGRLLDSLRARGDLDNTIVIVTSDHGELLGEHGLTNHGNALYMQLLHVPLVVRLPGAAAAGTRIAEPVGLQDLPATILDLAGAAPGRLPGASLRSLWESTPARAGSVFSEARQPPERALVWGPVRDGTMRSLVHERWHYIRNGDGTEELYDHVADPAERHDLARDREEPRLDAFRATLRDMLPARAQRPVIGRSGGGARP